MTLSCKEHSSGFIPPGLLNEFTVTNYGLVAVDNARIDFPAGFGAYEIEVFTEVVPERLGAMESVTVPYRITKRVETASYAVGDLYLPLFQRGTEGDSYACTSPSVIASDSEAISHYASLFDEVRGYGGVCDFLRNINFGCEYEVCPNSEFARIATAGAKLVLRFLEYVGLCEGQEVTTGGGGGDKDEVHLPGGGEGELGSRPGGHSTPIATCESGGPPGGRGPGPCVECDQCDPECVPSANPCIKTACEEGVCLQYWLDGCDPPPCEEGDTSCNCEDECPEDDNPCTKVVCDNKECKVLEIEGCEPCENEGEIDGCKKCEGGRKVAIEDCEPCGPEDELEPCTECVDGRKQQKPSCERCDGDDISTCTPSIDLCVSSICNDGECGYYQNYCAPSTDECEVRACDSRTGLCESTPIPGPGCDACIVGEPIEGESCKICQDGKIVNETRSIEGAACGGISVSGEMTKATELVESALKAIPFVSDPSVTGEIFGTACPTCCNGEELDSGEISYGGSLTGTATISKTYGVDVGPVKSTVIVFDGHSYHVEGFINIGPTISATPSLTIDAGGSHNLCSGQDCFDVSGCGSVSATAGGALTAEATVLRDNIEWVEIGVDGNVNATATAAAEVNHDTCNVVDTVSGCMGDLEGNTSLTVFGREVFDKSVTIREGDSNCGCP